MGVPVVTGSAAPPRATTADRRRELGACLRSYRERVAPATLGLPDRGRRRTPGLRREEVAVLAGVGLLGVSVVTTAARTLVPRTDG